MTITETGNHMDINVLDTHMTIQVLDINFNHCCARNHYFADIHMTTIVLDIHMISTAPGTHMT